MTNIPPPEKVRPPYLLGILCLIPLVGAFVGIVMIILGLVKYRDRWFTAIGAFGILFTIGIYGWLFYFATHNEDVKKGFAEISKMQMISLVKSIEMYKLQHGQYPEDLRQVTETDKMAPVIDPAQGLSTKGMATYNYKKLNDKYTLFSSGSDGMPNTKDDLYPEIEISDSSKIGLVKLSEDQK